MTDLDDRTQDVHPPGHSRARRVAPWAAVAGAAVTVLVAGLITIFSPADGGSSSAASGTGAGTPSASAPGTTATSASPSSMADESGVPSVDADAIGPIDTPGGPWRRIVTEEFDTPAAVGAFPGSAYRKTWSTYPDGWKDTSGVGTYAPSRTLSVGNGALNIHVGKDGDEFLAAAVVATPTYGQTYGRYAVRWRSDMVSGYGMAGLLWPDSNVWPDGGEIDFPEGYLNATTNAFLHPAGGGTQQIFPTGEPMLSWHTAVVEWTPGNVTFVLDGRVIGRSTTGVPSAPMHWLLQVGTDGRGTPPADASGTIQIDWVHIDAYRG